MRDRFTKRRVAQTIGIVLIVIGGALLLLPYQQDLELSSPGGLLMSQQDSFTIRCEAPLLDAVHGESNAWFNYAPPGTVVGRSGQDDGPMTGSYCNPESTWRGVGGVSSVVVGTGVLAVTAFIGWRRRRADAAEPPVVSPAPA